jgi:cleavage stimulation factor subunit 3
VFSQTVKRFKEKPGMLPKLKPLYAYFHKHEAKVGELAQIKELERQMTEAFPEDPALTHFAARFSTDRFNPVVSRVIISPTAQMCPKNIMQSVEHVSPPARESPHPSVLLDRSPRNQFLQTVNSPKRPFQADDQDDANPPRKFARGPSPLKGAAGRRMDQQRRAAGQVSTYDSTPAPISRDITFLLGLIPPAKQYELQPFRPDAMVRIIGETTVPDFNEWKAKQGQAPRYEQPQFHPQARQVSTEYPYQRSQGGFPPVNPYAAQSGQPQQYSLPNNHR